MSQLLPCHCCERARYFLVKRYLSEGACSISLHRPSQYWRLCSVLFLRTSTSCSVDHGLDLHFPPRYVTSTLVSSYVWTSLLCVALSAAGRYRTLRASVHSDGWWLLFLIYPTWVLSLFSCALSPLRLFDRHSCPILALNRGLLNTCVSRPPYFSPWTQVFSFLWQRGERDVLSPVLEGLNSVLPARPHERNGRTNHFPASAGAIRIGDAVALADNGRWLGPTRRLAVSSHLRFHFQ